MGANEPTATVREVDGQLVIDDPMALAMVRSIEKHNCRALFDLNRERVVHFVGRMQALKHNSKSYVIMLLNVDDPHGGPIADILMGPQPETWKAYRDKGEIPCARGLAMRDGIEELLTRFDRAAFEKLSAYDGGDLDWPAVVVVDRGVAEIFSAQEVK